MARRHKPIVIAPTATTALCVAGFILGQATSGIWFKLAADRQGRQALLWFVAANAAGFLCAICLPLALRGHAQPNLIYALCIGGGFCALQIASAYLFRTSLSTAQWAGVALVFAGLLFLSFGASADR